LKKKKSYLFFHDLSLPDNTRLSNQLRAYANASLVEEKKKRMEMNMFLKTK